MPISLGSPETPGKIVLTSVNAAYEATDDKRNEPDYRHGDADEDENVMPDSHRGDAYHDEKEPKYVNVDQDSKGSDSVGGGEKGLESSDGNVVQHENDSEHLDNEENAENTNTDSGDIKPKALNLDFDEEYDVY